MIKTSKALFQNRKKISQDFIVSVFAQQLYPAITFFMQSISGGQSFAEILFGEFKDHSPTAKESLFNDVSGKWLIT